MRLKRWPIDTAAATGAAIGVVLALWALPERMTARMTDLWCAGVVGLCVAAVVGGVSIHNRYLR